MAYRSTPSAAGTIDQPPGVVPPLLPHDTAPESHRAGVVFLLDMMAVAREGRRPIDALLLLVIMQANAAVGGSTDAGLRPISINGLASSLRLPFESVRRRVRRLAQDGQCHIGREGVIMPIAVREAPPRQLKAQQACDRLRGYYGELAGRGGLAGLPTGALPEGADANRIATGILAEYLLRVMDVAQSTFGDLIDCLLLLETFCANTEHLPHVAPPEGEGGLIRVFADHDRRPVRTAVLARRSGFATETTRRHAANLARRGLLEASPRGLIVPSAALLGPEVLRFALENIAQTRRMFVQLAQAGVLAAWDAEAQGEPAALTA